MSGNEDKTESATPRKRLEASRQGDRLRSRDLNAAGVGLGFLVWLAIFGGQALGAVKDAVRAGLTLSPGDGFHPGLAIAAMLRPLAMPMLALGVVLMLAAAGSGAALGSGFAWGAIMPRWTRIDPLAGLKRLFGGEALTGLGFALLKVIAGLGLILGYGYGVRGRIAGLAVVRGAEPFAPATAMLAGLLCDLGLLMLIAGAIDLFIQWRRREARLRMSKQEVREETKSNEGAPERKRQQRERQYAIATRSARKAMTEATVVLTNPSHFAVALRYRVGVDGVPVVVARGRDGAALAIRDLAAANAVPVMESPVLARALFFTSRTGDPVVNELYLAVATVLALIFDLDARVLRERRIADETVPPSMRFGPNGRLEA